MNADNIDDEALEQSERLDRIASELFEVDKKGIALQGALSLFVASAASISSYFAASLDPVIVLLVFAATFLPNFGVKVIAEYIKKRALVEGMKQGYVEGRKDSALSDSAYTQMAGWIKVYNALNSATMWRSV